MLMAALAMVEKLGDDEMLRRLGAVLQRVLPEDGEPLLGLLEHVADSHVLIEGDNVWARYLRRINPFARLFERTGTAPRASHLPQEECLHATRVGARIAMTLAPRPAGGWRPTTQTVDAARRFTPEERAYVADTTRSIQARLRARRQQA
ncbi:MAG TPA: hypothetical protein VGR62_23770 [Candidatus Binatia bacterium]|nr:hypothetical protein [Candidatus Binatia bacterium]